MEESAREEADGCCGKEDHYWPSWYLVWVWALFMQLHVLETIRVDWIFEVLDSTFELLHPISTYLFIELLDKHRGYLFLEL